MARKIKVLIVDDSALMRGLLSEILSNDSAIEVVGVAADPLVARRKIKALNPDVLTLDVEMPRMDGITFLRKLMALRPMPVVMVSSLTQKGAEVTLEALEIGAVDFIGKPSVDLQAGMLTQTTDLIDKIKVAAASNVAAFDRAKYRGKPRLLTASGFKSTEKIIAIGASTGGVEALSDVLSQLPPNSPAVLVVQHMPPDFTKSFAARLDGKCSVTVAEATHNTRALPGHVYIAPGGRHLELSRSGANYMCKLNDATPVRGHRPSADVLFHSTAVSAGGNAVGVILTGMGKDGADGLLAMREAGAPTLGQDEASCVVYGMPRAAFELGSVGRQASLKDIPARMLEACRTAARQGIRI